MLMREIDSLRGGPLSQPVGNLTAWQLNLCFTSTPSSYAIRSKVH